MLKTTIFRNYTSETAQWGSNCFEVVLKFLYLEDFDSHFLILNLSKTESNISWNGKNRAKLKVAFFQKVWCIFLIAQKKCRKLSWKRYFEIAFCLDSNCTAVPEGGEIQNAKLRIERSTFLGNGNNTNIFLRISDLYIPPHIVVKKSPSEIISMHCEQQIEIDRNWRFFPRIDMSVIKK